MYNTTALSIGGALAAAYAGMSIPMLAMNPGVTAIVGGLTMLASFVGVQYMRPMVVTENVAGVPAPIYKTQNPISRILLYSLGVASLGLSASPIFMYMQAISPSIITSSLGITLGIFGGASLMAYNMPKDKMLGYGRIFMGSLLGLIGMQLVGLGSAFFMGPNALSTLLFQIDNYVGILLFAGLIGYDTHVAINQYENGNADHLGMSIQMLLNFWNILLRIMQIMSNFKD
jgi:FtsH-binding integral membrane protein